MFWRMPGLSTSSPVETIMDKENFTLEDLLDEDEIIQECKSMNSRLINFLRERDQVKQLLRYIVEEAHVEDTEKARAFKFPFVACEIFTCEVDIILKTLVEDEELMKFLFSFLEPEHSHSTLLAGYFSKVVISLLLRKTVPFMNYIQDHPEIIRKLVDLIGITSIMEVLIRLISADEHLYTNFMGSMKWLEDTDVLEMIVDKFSSSESPEVHVNAAEILCALTRYAPPGLAAKISSPSFVGRLFHHALGDTRPNSVLVNSLSVCISLLDSKRLTMGTYHTYNRYMAHGPTVSPNPETVEGMVGSLGDLLKLLDSPLHENVLVTTYGKLQPPLGKHRLKIVEFISVLVTVSNEIAEGELIRLGALKQILELFFKYPYNNFLHHHVEHIVVSCLESKNITFTEHLLKECNLIGKILDTEKNLILVSEPTEILQPTRPAEGKEPPRIGNIGHITRIANKIVQLGNSNSRIQEHLQKNSEWDEWKTDILSKRNGMENIHQWGCGRPNFQQGRTRDSDDDDYQDRDYDINTSTNNQNQTIYQQDEIDETHGSIDRDDEDIYFDDESAEVVISSLRLGDDKESGSSLFTNSNWFAFEEERIVQENSGYSVPSSSTVGEADNRSEDTGVSNDLEPLTKSECPPEEINNENNPPEWVEWREPSEVVSPPPPSSSSVEEDTPCLPCDSDVHPKLEEELACSSSEPALILASGEGESEKKG